MYHIKSFKPKQVILSVYSKGAPKTENFIILTFICKQALQHKVNLKTNTVDTVSF